MQSGVPAGHLSALGEPGDPGGMLADLLVAGRYVPRGPDGEPTAGDFYDVLRLDDDRVAVVLGDVAGHGAPALGRMRALRAATAGCAADLLGPCGVLAHLDGVLADGPEESLATLWYAEYAPSSGTLAYASAGHPPPVLHGPGTGTGLLALTDAPPLGTGVVGALAGEHAVALPPGAVLVVYSDGLVERSGLDLAAQLTVLRDVVSSSCTPGRTVDEMADAVLAALVPVPEQAQDDVCLVVVQRAPASS